MAVAGIHNVSVLESSYHGENYPPVSRRWDSQERSTTRTSSIRKMWRELEGESRHGETGRRLIGRSLDGNVESLCSSEEGGDESENASMDANEVENYPPQGQIGLQNEQEDDRPLCLQRSPSIGIAEKERVRRIFREWGSKSFEGHSSYMSRRNNCSSRAQWNGENEYRSVRIVREWIESTSSTQQENSCRAGTEELASEIGSQAGQVRDGLGIGNYLGVGARRSIRRLYGRQALLDLLMKFERERKRELQGLLEIRLVSNFAHRNRIQSLLRGRFLRNQRFVQDEKPASIAARELGLLRQTHAVSDLRKGFLSRLNDHEHTPDGAESDTSSHGGMTFQCNEQAQENSQELPDEIDEYLTTNMTNDTGGFHTNDWETHTCGSQQDVAATDGERHEQGLGHEEREQLQPTVELIETRSRDQEDAIERIEGVDHVESSRETLGTECRAQGTLLDVDEIMGGHYQSNGEEQEVYDLSAHPDPLEISMDSLSFQEGFAEDWQEPATEDEGGYHHLISIGSDEDIDVNSHENEHRWYQGTAGSDFQESHEQWYENVPEENTESWVGGTSYQEAAPVVRTSTFYSSDDDNGNRLELTELRGRRRVSNILQSDFRVRLDQLIQSYVERQDQAFESDDEWMLDREQDLEQHGVDENSGEIEAVERTEGAHPSLPAISETHWEYDTQDVTDWRHSSNIRQHLGTEWEIINGLRIDMARLQERMNSMQKMLESCMDMQLELQRLVQQEVSSALNRSSSSQEACENGLQMDEAKWSPGKEGVCFLCCNSSFGSLPDRCGHVYLCSKCAEKIDWSKLKESIQHP